MFHSIYVEVNEHCKGKYRKNIMQLRLTNKILNPNAEKCSFIKQHIELYPHTPGHKHR